MVSLTWSEDRFRLASWSAAGLTHSLSYDDLGRVDKIVVAGSSTWTSEYQYDSQGMSAFKVDGAWHYLDRSMRGDIDAIRSGTGVREATIRYSAYGESWDDNASLVARLGVGYDGRDDDVSTGSDLYWMGARVMSSAEARFASNDPLQARVGSVQSSYNYADGDPINHADNLGQGVSWYWWYYKVLSTSDSKYLYRSCLASTTAATIVAYAADLPVPSSWVRSGVAAVGLDCGAMKKALDASGGYGIDIAIGLVKRTIKWSPDVYYPYDSFYPRRPGQVPTPWKLYRA